MSFRWFYDHSGENSRYDDISKGVRTGIVKPTLVLENKGKTQLATSRNSCNDDISVSLLLRALTRIQDSGLTNVSPS